MIVDIGDVCASRFGGIQHYVVHMACWQLAGTAYPRQVREAVSAFISGLGFRYLMGALSRSMYEAAKKMSPLYAKLEAATTSTMAL